MRRSAFFLTGFVFLAVLVMPNAARAQTVDPWTALQQVQVDLKADRQAVVAANLPLTEGEARAFWPVYKDYRGEIEKIGAAGGQPDRSLRRQLRNHDRRES